MNNNINTLLNSLSDLGKIRKADKKNDVESSTSDNTMTIGTKRKIYQYFPKNKEQLQEIIAKKILDEGYECNLNDIDIRGVGTDLSELFYWNDEEAFWTEQYEQNEINICYFNGNISDWDVSNVKDMSWMFHNCSSFNQDISNWNVSNVEDMYGMFIHCSSFDQNISGWDVHNVKYKKFIFAGCPIKEKHKPKFNY